MRPKQKGNVGSSRRLEQQRPDVQIVSVLRSSKHTMIREECGDKSGNYVARDYTTVRTLRTCGFFCCLFNYIQTQLRLK